MNSLEIKNLGLSRNAKEQTGGIKQKYLYTSIPERSYSKQYAEKNVDTRSLLS